MSISVNDLKNLEICENSYLINNRVESVKNMYYYLAIGIKSAVTNAVRKGDFNEKSVRKILKNKLPNDMFLPLVKEENINQITNLIGRYFAYIRGDGFKVLATNVVEDVRVGGELITVSADLVLKDENGDINVVNLKRSAPKMSYRGRKYESIPSNNIELYLLKKLGEKTYGSAENVKVYGAFHHLEGKGDKKNFLRYEVKKGHNIIRCSFKDEYAIKGVINNLLKRSGASDFRKTEDKNNCKNCSFENICNYSKPSEIEWKEIKEEVKAPSNFKLTDSQREAVLFNEGVARINAGAGSGKTTVVALRVNELILNGCNPEDILMTTFTNKGAQEMKEKVRYWLGKEGQEISDEELNITTFNAWGDKIIKENYKDLGFKSEPKLIDKVEKYDILFEILKNGPRLSSLNYKNPVMNFRYAQGAVAELSGIFDYIKANNITTVTSLREVVNKDTSEILKMYKQYNKILKNRGFIEYHDQINMVMKLTETGSPIMKKYDYKHIITDEFQDTDAVQIDLIMYLANQPSFKSLMVVGDDSQSIFSFRNTTPENILNFHKMFNKVKDIKIIENFRSTPEIITLANYLNSLNKNKIDKTLISGKANGMKPLITGFETQDEEHKQIALKVKNLLDSKEYNPEGIAIIGRTKYELFNIQNELEKLKIPQVLDIPEPLINNIEIHMAKNLAKFIGDTKVTQGLYEYLMIVTDDFEDMNQIEIEELLKDEKENIVEILKENTDESDEMLLSQTQKELFFGMLDIIEDKELNSFVESIKRKNFTFNQVKSYLKKFIEYEDPKTIDKDDKKYRAVTLTTAHTSKGKEFEVVFNTITKYQPDNNEKAIEEERRLLFVSITRAKQELYISFTKSKRNSFQKKYSGFPEELMSSDKLTIKAS